MPPEIAKEFYDRLHKTMWAAHGDYKAPLQDYLMPLIIDAYEKGVKDASTNRTDAD